MGAPNLTVTVEPVEAGAVVYGPLAPRSASSPPNGQLSLKLWVRNNEKSKIHANELRISFVGAPAVSPVTIPLSLDVSPGETKSWFFATANTVVLPVPAPGNIRLNLK